ncbi:MAG: hypothetical protein RLZZ234_509 [Candidatus Parcubacteria bacterium]|jgi:predicted metalloprotease
MALWDKIGSRGNVDDRRGLRSAGGLSITGVLLLVGVTYLMGGDPLAVLTQIDPSAFEVQTTSTEETAEFAGEDSYELFVSQVLGSLDDMWAREFTKSAKIYQKNELVLFRGRTQSACGGASEVVGPHYCPNDEKIYLDETFFNELTERLGAKGGDVAEAYVIAHEAGHHVQHQLGTLDSGADSIQVELQADCFAGMWAHSLRDQSIFAPGEIAEAMDAAASVGDDRIQERMEGTVQPETWTHGSSAARVEAFTLGYEEGSLKECLSYTEGR